MEELLMAAETKGAEPEETKRAEPAGNAILVVDDDVQVAKLAASVLGRLGYLPTVLHSPVAALERVRQMPDEFDAIMTDYRMPGMTGLTMIRAIRAAGIGIPVLVVSGYGEELTPENLEGVGVGPVLSKPYSRDELKTRLEGLLPTAPKLKP